MSQESNRYKEALLSETREELAKADSKASILLASTGIAFAALLTAAGAGTWTPEKMRHGDAGFVIWFSIALALIGICLLGAAVKPRLRARDQKKDDLHYFGDVRAYWPNLLPLGHRKENRKVGRAEYDKALNSAANDENYESRLNDQIWFLGRIAFRKYRLVSNSLWVFSAAIAFAIISLLLEKY